VRQFLGTWQNRRPFFLRFAPDLLYDEVRKAFPAPLSADHVDWEMAINLCQKGSDAGRE
jgi:hypothetical protein